MKEVERLYTISPELVDAIASLNDWQRGVLIIEACRYALAQAGIEEPLPWLFVTRMNERDSIYRDIIPMLLKLREVFEEQYFTATEEDRPDDEISGFFHKARAISALLQADQSDSYRAAVDSLYEASMTAPDQHQLLHRLLLIATQLIVRPSYASESLVELYQRVFARHYQSFVRAWDLKSENSFDKAFYEQVLTNVIEVDQDSESDARSYWASSAMEAALFLLETQRDQGFWLAEPDECVPDQQFNTMTFKTVFHAQTADTVPFMPFLTSLKDTPRFIAGRELAAFCFLTKVVTEKNVSITLPAYLAQTVGLRHAVPTQMLDWTSDPYVAVMTAITQKPEKSLATVYFTTFESLDNVVLPPPFGMSMFRQRGFCTAMQSQENESIRRRSCRISFPVSELPAPLNPPFHAPPAELDNLPASIADLARKLAETPTLSFDQLYASRLEDRNAGFLQLRNALSRIIDQLCSQYDYSREWWDAALQNWLVEIDYYLFELLGFTNSQGKWFLSEPAMLNLVKLNKEALSLYVDYIVSKEEEFFDQRRLLLKKLIDAMQNVERKPVPIRLQSHGKASASAVNFKQSVEADKPLLVPAEVPADLEEKARAADALPLCV